MPPSVKWALFSILLQRVGCTLPQNRCSGGFFPSKKPRHWAGPGGEGETERLEDAATSLSRTAKGIPLPATLCSTAGAQGDRTSVERGALRVEKVYRSISWSCENRWWALTSKFIKSINIWGMIKKACAWGLHAVPPYTLEHVSKAVVLQPAGPQAHLWSQAPSLGHSGENLQNPHVQDPGTV